MPKNERQKLKLLYLKKILEEQTDADHPMSMAQLLVALEKHGIRAERKSIYDDIAALRDFGVDIEKTADRTAGYYVASRTFELPELKLLVDAVQSSKFITHKKSTELIRKLEGFTSTHEARRLSRQVYVKSRVKTMNESIYYTVDFLHEAMLANKQITFLYFEWNMHGERVLRHGGKRYAVSPWALTWDDENYYLLAYESESGIVKHFRVDKILSVQLTDTPREGASLFSDFDTGTFSRKVFGMFGGEEMLVVLRCHHTLAGVILDRFGTDTRLNPCGESFTVTVKVIISPQFLSWAAGFGDRMYIESPDAVRERLRALVNSIPFDGFSKKEDAK